MKKNRPPKWADNFLEWYCAPQLIEEIQGDLHEAYYRRFLQNGAFFANLYFILDVVRSLSFRTVDWRAIYSGWSIATFQLNFITTARKFSKRKSFLIINTIGLSTSFAAAILIFMYVSNELSFDLFHKKAERIYRVYCAYAKPGETIRTFPYTPPVFSTVIRKEVTGIESIARLNKVYGAAIVKMRDKVFSESDIYRADSSLFNIFTIRFLQGNPVHALSQPASIVLSRSTAIKYFGSVDLALNQTLNISIYGDEDYRVTGVVQDLPLNSHFRFNALLSYDYQNESFHPDNWLAHDPVTYVLISDKTKSQNVETSIKRIVDRILDPIHFSRFGDTYEARKSKGALQEYRLQSLKDVHLHSAQMGEKGGIVYIYLFSSVGIILIGIACFNYINLSTAQMAWEAKGASIRKVLGATRRQLRALFLTESMSVTIIASLVAVVLVQGLLTLNIPVVRQFTPFSGWNIESAVILFCLALIVGFFSGMIPARLIGTFDSTKVLKGQMTNSTKGGVLRQIFVALQFTVSIGLIICTLFVTQQLVYVQTKSLGFKKENLLVIGNVDKLGSKALTLKEALENESMLVQSTLCYNKIGEPHNSAAFTPVELIEEGRGDLVIGIPVYIGDEDYLETLGVELLIGHSFPKGLDRKNQQIILNEEALRAVGWQGRKAEDIIGKSIDVNGLRYELAGIVDNYHFESLHQRIGPIAILSHYYQGYENLMLRIKPHRYNEAIFRIGTHWKKIAPDIPFEYSFLDEELNQLYAAEENIELLFKSFAILAIMIACLGLLGLSVFSVERRTKEIGVRKVLGASAASIVFLLTKNIASLIVLAFLIASPLAWYLIDHWLSTFAYKIEVTPITFLIAGAMTFVVALLTIGIQSLKAGITNPVESLKYE